MKTCNFYDYIMNMEDTITTEITTQLTNLIGVINTNVLKIRIVIKLMETLVSSRLNYDLNILN